MLDHQTRNEIVKTALDKAGFKGLMGAIKAAPLMAGFEAAFRIPAAKK